MNRIELEDILTNNANNDQNLLCCDNIKAVLMIAIALGHCICVFRTTGWGSYSVGHPSYAFDLINGYLDFLTYSFCTISGYLYFYNRIYRNKYRKILGTVFHRAKRLLIPYFAVGTLWCYPVGGALGKYLFSADSYVEQVIKGKGLGQLWFLMMLFTVFCAFHFFGNLMINGNELLIIISLFLAGGLADRFYAQISFLDCIQLRTAFRYALSYYLGLVILRHPIKMNPMFGFIGNIIAYAVFILQKNGMIHFPYSSITGYLAKAAFLYSGVLFVISMDQYIRKIDFGISKIFCFLKDNNFRIYLVHQQLIEVSIVLLSGMVCNAVLFISNFVFAFFGSFLLLKGLDCVKECMKQYSMVLLPIRKIIRK